MLYMALFTSLPHHSVADISTLIQKNRNIFIDILQFLKFLPRFQPNYKILDTPLLSKY